MKQIQQQPKVLIAESDRVFLHALSKRLEQRGIEVSIIYDGEKIFTRLKTFKPDLLVIASILPFQHGFDILKSCREQEEFKSLSVILLSTLGSLEEEALANKLGVRQFIVKSQLFISEVVQRIINEAKIATKR